MSENFGDDLTEVFDLDMYGIYLTTEEADYDLHQEHGLCGCWKCEEHRKKFL